MQTELNGRPQAMIAMSGGVDSSVAAYLMQQAGYACMGATMRLYENEDAGLAQGSTCCALDDVEDARRVAYTLGMPHYVFNYKDAFREQVMARFRRGELPVFVAPDVASRGIDVDDVDCVINYDVPEENEYYVHRIGRTGRAKKKGVAWSIVSNFPEKARLDDICKYCNFTIQPMVMDKDGNLSPEEVKAPVTPKRRFR